MFPTLHGRPSKPRLAGPAPKGDEGDGRRKKRYDVWSLSAAHSATRRKAIENICIVAVQFGRGARFPSRNYVTRVRTRSEICREANSSYIAIKYSIRGHRDLGSAVAEAMNKVRSRGQAADGYDIGLGRRVRKPEALGRRASAGSFQITIMIITSSSNYVQISKWARAHARQRFDGQDRRGNTCASIDRNHTSAFFQAGRRFLALFGRVSVKVASSYSNTSPPLSTWLAPRRFIEDAAVEGASLRLRRS